MLIFSKELFCYKIRFMMIFCPLKSSISILYLLTGIGITMMLFNLAWNATINNILFAAPPANLQQLNILVALSLRESLIYVCIMLTTWLSFTSFDPFADESSVSYLYTNHNLKIKALVNFCLKYIAYIQKCN